MKKNYQNGRTARYWPRIQWQHCDKRGLAAVFRGCGAATSRLMQAAGYRTALDECGDIFLKQRPASARGYLPSSAANFTA
jgi:hypothetical protein